MERHGEDGVERLGMARRPADVERVAQPQVDLPFDEVLGPLVLEPAGHDRGELDLALDDLDRQVDPDVGMEVERRGGDRVAQDAALVGEGVGEVGGVEQDPPDRRVIRGPVAGRRRPEDVRRPALLQDPGERVLHPRRVVGDPVVGRVEELDRGAERGGHVARGGLLDRRHGHDVDVVVGMGDERAADAVDEVIGVGRDDQDLHERPSRSGSAGTGRPGQSVAASGTAAVTPRRSPPWVRASRRTRPGGNAGKPGSRPRRSRGRATAGGAGTPGASRA